MARSGWGPLVAALALAVAYTFGGVSQDVLADFVEERGLPQWLWVLGIVVFVVGAVADRVLFTHPAPSSASNSASGADSAGEAKASNGDGCEHQWAWWKVAGLGALVLPLLAFGAYVVYGHAQSYIAADAEPHVAWPAAVVIQLIAVGVLALAIGFAVEEDDAVAWMVAVLPALLPAAGGAVAPSLLAGESGEVTTQWTVVTLVFNFLAASVLVGFASVHDDWGSATPGTSWAETLAVVGLVGLLLALVGFVVYVYAGFYIADGNRPWLAYTAVIVALLLAAFLVGFGVNEESVLFTGAGVLLMLAFVLAPALVGQVSWLNTILAALVALPAKVVVGMVAAGIIDEL